MVIDQRYRNRYLFAGLSPRQPFPGRWYKHGTVKKAATIEALAAEIDVPADALRATLERFNGFAASGVDEDFHRGESAYDKYYSDPTVKPNPSLHVIDHAPFYAVKIVPGDLGTKGGLVTDERARVLRPDGSVIAGLYAAGNVSSAVMGHTYAGPGATIGPALAFGYLAAEDIARPRRPVRPAETAEGDRLMPIDPSRRDRRRPVGERVLLVVVERRPALPPRHRRRLPPGRQPRPRRAALDHRRRRACRCCRRSAWWCRRSTDRPAAAGPARLRHQPVPGRARLAVDHRARADADVRLGDRPHDAHRRLGQGQGRGDLAGGRRAPPTTGPRTCGPRAPRSSSAARAAGAATAARPSRSTLPDRAPDAETTYDDHPAAGAALPPLRRPQPAALRPRLRQGGRLPGADPARALLLRDRAARAHRRRCSAATPPRSAASR